MSGRKNLKISHRAMHCKIIITFIVKNLKNDFATQILRETKFMQILSNRLLISFICIFSVTLREIVCWRHFTSRLLMLIPPFLMYNTYTIIGSSLTMLVQVPIVCIASKDLNLVLRFLPWIQTVVWQQLIPFLPVLEMGSFDLPLTRQSTVSFQSSVWKFHNFSKKIMTIWYLESLYTSCELFRLLNLFWVWFV